MKNNCFYNYCFNLLQSVETILSDITLTPFMKLRLMTKRNILKHLVDYKNFDEFISQDEIEQYIEDRTDIICGFYDDDEIDNK